MLTMSVPPAAPPHLLCRSASTQVCAGQCCAAGSTCVSGQCCPSGQQCSGQCCQSGFVCINNQCAPDGSTPCGSTFCPPGQQCAGGEWRVMQRRSRGRLLPPCQHSIGCSWCLGRPQHASAVSHVHDCPPWGTMQQHPYLSQPCSLRPSHLTQAPLLVTPPPVCALLPPSRLPMLWHWPDPVWRYLLRWHLLRQHLLPVR